MSAASPISIFIPDHPQAVRTLRHKLEEERRKRCEDLGNGAATDWPDYTHRAGAIQGLALAIRICDEIEKDLRN